ncbi:MAG: copper-binding protein [Bryobacteraceae bacterium]|jgi:Cu/Ag efflux protein CusF
MPHRFLSILLLAFALCACKKPVSKAPIERYKLDGVIVALDPEGHIAKINGQKIEGYMEAMTMEYPVKDQSEFSPLHVGDHITATVFVQDLNYWIGEIHQVR